MGNQNRTYYVGLDIGTDSVGYAVTNPQYQLCKVNGEPVWGVQLFEAAENAAERRTFRSARRRLDRKRQRTEFVQMLFAPEIAKVDPNFFVRLQESFLYRDEADSPFTLFADKGYTDREYHKRYPTIHHLIAELMESTEPHDVRLVYLACAWLVSHRGHFLLDVDPEDTAGLTDFSGLYDDLVVWMDEREWMLPWSRGVCAEGICDIMKSKLGITKKQNRFCMEVLKEKKLPKAQAENIPDPGSIIKLLCGAKVKPAQLFGNDAYNEENSVALGDDDETFAQTVASLGEDGALLTKLRALYDCAMLQATLEGKGSISEAKIEIYESHQKDLKYLKAFVKKYIPEKYNEIFRDASTSAANYVAYVNKTSDLRKNQISDKFKKAGKDMFCEWLKKLVSKVSVMDCDQPAYDDMLERLNAGTFLPKQKDTDNRIIPYQLYYVELKKLVERAMVYLPFLAGKDSTGLAVKDKLLSIFTFRIPYFVGPVNPHSDHGWIVRKTQEKIYPWNFERVVDFDESEEAFINQMTGICTYIHGENVLPRYSLLYCKYTVLNTINNLRINNIPISVPVKQKIFSQVFMPNPECGAKQTARVTKHGILNYMRANGFLGDKDELGGIDTNIGASMLPYFKFRKLMERGILTESQVDQIICRFSYTEDRKRRVEWLKRKFPTLGPEDQKYVSRLSLGEFGRLSQRLLTGISGVRCETGEYFGSIMDALWNTNDNLMQLLSDKYTFKETIEAANQDYYAEHSVNLSRQLDEMYISNGVKRPILRTLDVVHDVVAAMRTPPAKIFIEMARGGEPSQKGKRTSSRLQQLQKLYQETNADVRELLAQLDSMGDMADNHLQSDKLFLYYLQLGKCAYTGQNIELSQLFGDRYNIDHIYPRAFVKDDSVLNNKVLVCSEINGVKKDTYPVDVAIRRKMAEFWRVLHESNLMTDEKYRRLTRQTGFTDEERWAFINRQLVETRQSTKAVAQLLRQKYPDTEIIYVKAGLVSEFRREFEMLKSRAVNDLHHAKDAYLNIVVGNVYDARFSKRWFSVTEPYSIKTRTIFTQSFQRGEQVVWKQGHSMEIVRKTVQKNHAYVTQYAFCRKGGLFDQNPLRAKEGLVPLHKNLPTARYGGYNKPTASFFSLARYCEKKKRGIMFVPVELMAAEQFCADAEFAADYVRRTIETIKGKPVTQVELLLGGRPLKIKTVLQLDGVPFVLNGKSNGGRQIIVSPLAQLVVSPVRERYIKRLESYAAKAKQNQRLRVDSEYDKITAQENIELFDILTQKMKAWPFNKYPANQADTLVKGREKFCALGESEQVNCLLNVLSILNGNGADLTALGGAAKAGGTLLSATISNWSKDYQDIRIVDQSAAGLHRQTSENLLGLL